ncbi:hypothetical protein HMPREF3027_06975 [Porphyromonas sp. HMSC077F02]|uniref:hypothetical protein n=1 Tax=Porphyromonas sp. HMSC077F02 TaxID=1739529 RepID=UPI0008A2D3A5|nr:hypothetical protein [Porphyromonas sp. HMSC077F02]OFO52160.1 hypothetical protein HMPREF3027_06975 [Porphyromonas sp. HMSC077F02]
MKRRKPTDGQIATLYAIVALAVCAVAAVLLAFLCAGCRPAKEVVQSHTATIQQGVKLERDSIRLPYQRHTARWFLPTGALEREEVSERGELVQVVERLQDTLYIVQRDTIREVTTPPPPPTATTLPARINATLWGVVIGATLVAIIIGVIKLRRLL